MTTRPPRRQSSLHISRSSVLHTPFPAPLHARVCQHVHARARAQTQAGAYAQTETDKRTFVYTHARKMFLCAFTHIRRAFVLTCSHVRVKVYVHELTLPPPPPPLSLPSSLSFSLPPINHHTVPSDDNRSAPGTCVVLVPHLLVKSKRLRQPGLAEGQTERSVVCGGHLEQDQSAGPAEHHATVVFRVV